MVAMKIAAKDFELRVCASCNSCARVNPVAAIISSGANISAKVG